MEGERLRPEEIMAIRGTPLQPNPGTDDRRIRMRMEPGVANPIAMGDPVTKEEIAREVGKQHPFHMMRTDVREAAKKIGYTHPRRNPCLRHKWSVNLDQNAVKGIELKSRPL